VSGHASIGDTALPRQPTLDGTRGLAVVAVILFHSAALAGRPTWFSGGFLGVSLFFVISGYIMTELLLTEHRDTGSIDVGRFAARRAKRVQPASLAVVAVSVLLALPSWSAWNGLHATDALAAVWGYMNWHVIALGTDQVIRGIGPLGPYWSLAVELQFYLCLALLSLWLRRLPDPRRVLWAAAGIAWSIGAYSMLFRAGTDLHREFGTEYRVAELATGMLLSLALGSRALAGRSLSTGTSTGIASAATALLIAGFLFADFTPPWLLSGGFLLVAIVSAALLHTSRHSPLWTAVYGSRPALWVGALSYSLYLVHWPVGLLLARHVSMRGAPFIAAAVAITFAAAIILHRVVEEPLRHRRSTPRRIGLEIAGASLAVSVLAIVALPW
jgi:peptidoglycan/LPS O-acetylase OafA/YrhL